MAPHIFVALTDVTKISCDAWIMSANHFHFKAFFHHFPHYFWLRYYYDKIKADPDHGMTNVPEASRMILKPYTNLIQEVVLPTEFKNAPLIFAVGVTAMTDHKDTDFISTLFTDALEMIINKIITNNIPKKNNRAKYLIAFPVIGTGMAGAATETGLIVDALLSTLLKIIKKYDDFDFVLCARDKPTYNVAQNIRLSRLHEFWEGSFIDKGSPLGPRYYKMDTIDRLAQLAVEGKLVIFIGAGVSIGAGMPSWNGLLEELATNNSIDIRSEHWKSLDYLSKAELIEKRLQLNNKGTLGGWIADRMDTPYFSIQHSLLAALRCKTVVTTNYDKCYENAFAALYDQTPENISIIPNNIASPSNYCLLKMHGCITKHEDIILTRQHYLRYMENKAALAGIVQASLLTSHMLFVGFSLDDENFHKIMDSVRKAKYGSECYATSLQLFKNKYVANIWHPDINAIQMRPQPKHTTGSDWSNAGRDVDIYLDLLATKASNFSCTYLLDYRFTGYLTNDEAKLKDAVEELMSAVSAQDCHESSVTPILNRMCDSYGYLAPKYYNMKVSYVVTNSPPQQPRPISENTKIASKKNKLLQRISKARRSK